LVGLGGASLKFYLLRRRERRIAIPGQPRKNGNESLSTNKPAMMAHVCISVIPVTGEAEDHSLRPAQAKNRRPYLKTN
jgi:hypothetical protein